METSVTIKATTDDLDLLRVAVETYAGAKTIDSKDPDLTPTQRRHAVVEAARASELRKKL